jgi:hypothetical protein
MTYIWMKLRKDRDMEDWVGGWMGEVLENGFTARHESQLKQPTFQHSTVFIQSRSRFHNSFLAHVQWDFRGSADVFQPAESLQVGSSLCE